MKGKVGGEKVRQKHEKRQKDKEETEWHKDRIRWKTERKEKEWHKDKIRGKTA